MKVIALLCLMLVTTQLVFASNEDTTTTCTCEREAILLHDIKELIFVKGANTLSRREPAIPQLECVGGSAKGTYEPNVVRCVNVGHILPHWRCEATLDSSVQLGSVAISCEGYTAPEDPYVFRGSCGLQYSLEYTAWGPYLWGKLLRALSILILTPLKWLAFAALTGFAGLVVLALIRRPATRARGLKRGEEHDWSLKWLQTQQKESREESEESEDSAWAGRLRPRKPASPVGAGTH